MIDYGAKGCRCWRGEDYNPWDDRTHHEWLPNAACPHHGLLADFTERMNTGVYTVISKPVTIEPFSPWPCDEGEDLRTGSAYTQAPATTEQESDDRPGILAALRRGIRRLFDGTGWH